jgi:type I restriction enzyme R subunit
VDLYPVHKVFDDNNVLGFAVEYVGKYKQKAPDIQQAEIFAGGAGLVKDESPIPYGDELVTGIDVKEVLESDKRLNDITEYILHDWKRKTKNGKFNALFATSNIEVLKKYYTLFKDKKAESFKIATIFT